MIPKNLHLIWIQGKDALRPLDKKNLVALERLNPDWKCIVWDNDSIDNLLKNQVPELIPMFRDPLGIIQPGRHEINPLATKSDIGRWVIMYVFGGAYLDMDVECVSSLTDILLDIPKGKPHMLAYGNSFVGIAGQMFMATPKHPILKQAVEFCKESQSQLEVGHCLTRAVHECPLATLKEISFCLPRQDLSMYHCGVSSKCMIPIRPESSDSIDRKMYGIWCQKKESLSILSLIFLVVAGILLVILYKKSRFYNDEVDYSTCEKKSNQYICDLKGNT